MILLIRDRSAAPRSFRGKTRVNRAVELITNHIAGQHAFNSSYWKSAKKVLKAESHGKCAYCEAATDVVAHGDVEHFRPKNGGYWWLAYCYDNYLYSCQICNESFKSHYFPVAGRKMPAPRIPKRLAKERFRAVAAMLAPDPLNDDEGMPFVAHNRACRRERALLPDPYGPDDPETFFAWEANRVLKEVRITPASPRFRARYAAVDEFLGLNRVELKKWRWRTYRQLETFAKGYRKSRDPKLKGEFADELREFMAPHSQFAAMARYFIRREWVLSV